MFKLEVDQVSVELKGIPVLKQVCAQIRENTITACIGPQGCGRGNFLRLFNRLNEVSGTGYKFTGEVKLDHKNVLALEPGVLRRRVGMLFREPHIFAGSILENVSFGLRIQGIKHKKFLAEVVERSLIAAELWQAVKDKLNAPVYALTTAQRQFVCLARALALEPPVMLLEEPTFLLDTMSAYRMEELIYNLKRKHTVLISTNSAHQASRLSDQTAFFHSGELIEFGDTTRIFTNPASARTENYITGRFS